MPAAAFPSFAPEASCSIASVTTLRNRQTFGMVRHRDEAPKVMLHPLLSNILLDVTRWGKQIDEPGRLAAAEPEAGEEVSEASYRENEC